MTRTYFVNFHTDDENLGVAIVEVTDEQADSQIVKDYLRDFGTQGQEFDQAKWNAAILLKCHMTECLPKDHDMLSMTALRVDNMGSFDKLTDYPRNKFLSPQEATDLGCINVHGVVKDGQIVGIKSAWD